MEKKEKVKELKSELFDVIRSLEFLGIKKNKLLQELQKLETENDNKENN